MPSPAQVKICPKLLKTFIRHILGAVIVRTQVKMLKTISQGTIGSLDYTPEERQTLARR